MRDTKNAAAMEGGATMVDESSYAPSVHLTQATEAFLRSGAGMGPIPVCKIPAYSEIQYQGLGSNGRNGPCPGRRVHFRPRLP
ncbi:hypothetical protein SBDP1_850011 [Syntrophobacter sp. SbD1]|nr:hypothetical protein SBDP1_850011 [Syntrophobacter sp. SbD1]